MSPARDSMRKTNQKFNRNNDLNSLSDQKSIDAQTRTISHLSDPKAFPESQNIVEEPGHNYIVRVRTNQKSQRMPKITMNDILLADGKQLRVQKTTLEPLSKEKPSLGLETSRFK